MALATPYMVTFKSIVWVALFDVLNYIRTTYGETSWHRFFIVQKNVPRLEKAYIRRFRPNKTQSCKDEQEYLKNA